MVILYEGTPEAYSMDGYLHENLKRAITVIKDDWDMAFLVDGYEGSGKSVLAMQMAKAVDPSFSIERIAFTPETFRRVVLAAQPYTAVQYDEAYTGLSSRAAMTRVNQILVSMLAEIRQKNLFVFIVAPTFFDIDKYVAIWRSRALIHVYTAENFKRGYFAFYNIDKKKELYVNGKKYYNYSNPKPNFTGRFVSTYVVDAVKYKKLKRDALLGKDDPKTLKEINNQVDDILFERIQELDIDIPVKAKLKLVRLSETTYYRRLKEIEEVKAIS